MKHIFWLCAVVFLFSHHFTLVSSFLGIFSFGKSLRSLLNVGLSADADGTFRKIEWNPRTKREAAAWRNAKKGLDGQTDRYRGVWDIQDPPPSPQSCDGEQQLLLFELTMVEAQHVSRFLPVSSTNSFLDAESQTKAWRVRLSRSRAPPTGRTADQAVEEMLEEKIKNITTFSDLLRIKLCWEFLQRWSPGGACLEIRSLFIPFLTTLTLTKTWQNFPFFWMKSSKKIAISFFIR